MTPSIVPSDGRRCASLMFAARRRERVLDLALLLPVVDLLAVFLVYPLVYGLDLSVNRTQGFEVTGSGRPRALRAGAPRRRGVPPGPREHPGVHGGRGRAPDGYRPPARGARLGDPARPDACSGSPSSPRSSSLRSRRARSGSSCTRRSSASCRRSAARWASISRASRRSRDPNTALWAIVLAFVWRFAGFSMVVYLAAMRSIPREYYEYGELEGIGRLTRLRRITWPLLWPQTFALTLLTTIATLRVFDLVWIMTEGGPGHATETVATYVYTTAFRSLDSGYAQAMATILMVVIVALAVVEYRLLNRRAEAVSGVNRPSGRSGGRPSSWSPLRWSGSTPCSGPSRTRSRRRRICTPDRSPCRSRRSSAISARRGTERNLGAALLNSAYVAALTVAGALLLAVPGRVRVDAPPAAGPRGAPAAPDPRAAHHPDRGAHRPAVLDLPDAGADQQPAGLALVNIVFSVSFATVDPRRLLPADPAGRHRRGAARRGGAAARC